MLNVQNDFPFFKNNKDLTYLDSASTSQKPLSVLQSFEDFYTNNNASSGRGNYDLSYNASLVLDNTRKTVANFINADSSQISYTTSTTDGINKLALMLEKEIKEGDEIILSYFEHHSNILPWIELSNRTGAIIKYFDPYKEEPPITLKTKLISIAHIYNVLGSITPIKSIVRSAKKVGAKVLLDACQSIAHIKIDAKDLDIDYLVFSGHKLFSINGVGILYIKDPTNLSPIFFGGGMIKDVQLSKASYLDYPEFMESGTQDVAAFLSLQKAIEYIESIGFDKIENHEKELLANIELPKVAKIIGNKDKYSLISFVIDEIHPHDIAQYLSNNNICIRAGHHCAKPLHRYFDIDASSRLSVSIYNSLEDIEIFNQKIEECVRYFNV